MYASLPHDLAGPRTGPGERHPIPSTDAMEATFSRLGIGRDTQVVLCDEQTGMFASRMWWMLRYLGHDAAAVLDGGWSKWSREGRQAGSGEETRPPAVFLARPRPEWRIDLHEVERRLADPALMLVDARAPERFEGRVETVDRLAGHIPGAVNSHYATHLTKDGTLLPVDQLRENFHRLLGDRAPGDVMMYCGSGVSACVNLLAMEHAGLHGAKLYPGSWSEWSGDPSRPVEPGEGRKEEERRVPP